MERQRNTRAWGRVGVVLALAAAVSGAAPGVRGGAVSAEGGTGGVGRGVEQGWRGAEGTAEVQEGRRRRRGTPEEPKKDEPKKEEPKADEPKADEGAGGEKGNKTDETPGGDKAGEDKSGGDKSGGDKSGDEQQTDGSRRKRSVTTTRAATGPSQPALRFTLKDVKGNDVDLMQFKGRVVILVAVAYNSDRRQFEDLQAFYKFWKDYGLVLVTVMTRDIGKDAGKETRTDAELAKLIDDRYGAISYVFCATVPAAGADAHPLFKYLAGGDHEFKGEVTAPFTKFVISRNGEIVGRAGPTTRILDRPYQLKIYDQLNTPIRQ